MVSRKSSFLLVLLLCLISASCLAQGQKFVFFEGLGGGLLASVNFDMRFKKDARDGLGAKVGYSNVGFFDTGEWISIFPVGINYVYGKKRGGLLAGFNTTFAFVPPDIGATNYVAAVYGPEIGYRFRPRNRGIGFQATWSPLFNTADGTKMAWFGIGVGYVWR